MESEDTGADPATDYRPGRILLCDDSHSERKLLARFLVDQGYIVEECDSGDAALSFLKAHEIDVLLLDLQMPGTDRSTIRTHAPARPARDARILCISDPGRNS